MSQLPVAGQVDVDRVAGPAQGAGESVDDIREPAGLGERLALGADHGDAHPPMVLVRTSARALRRPRRP